MFRVCMSNSVVAFLLLGFPWYSALLAHLRSSHLVDSLVGLVVITEFVEMAVFTFVIRESGGTWTATQHGGEHNLKESASSTFELERKLVNLALQTAGSNSVSSSFNIITPTSAVAQVILGGGGGGGFGTIGGGGVPASGSAPPAAAPAEEEKKEEEEEESEGDIGFSLFDE